VPASTEQKVDFLLKKIGYSASKTGGVEGSSGTVDGTKKKPSEEAIPSPLIVPSTSLWSDSVSIPATPPGSDTFPVKVYATASAYRLTVDNSVSESRSFIARSTYGNHTSSIDGNWIDSQFGADYAVRVFKGDPNSSGVELSQAGATGNDTWFFDYSSGILNFTGTDNHASLGVTDTNIYILGYRYTGGVGAKPPSGIGTFSSLYVTGISTFVGVVDINGGGQANTFKVEDLTAGRVVLAGTGGEIEDSGNLTFDANSNLTVTGGVKVTGITTLGSVGISTGLISGPATMYIDPATVGDDTGLLVVKGNLQVDGTQTTVNSSTMTVTDKNIVVAQGSANDAASDGAGITVDAGSDTDKTWNWVDATDAWTSSENIQIAAGKQLGFADDTDTYIDRPAADTIKFTTGGSERLRINTDGNTKITGALNVTGLSTFTGAIDANGDLDVDGHTNLDNLSVVGVSTFTTPNGTVRIGTAATTLIVEGDTRITGILSVGQGTITLDSSTNNGTMTLGSLTLHRDSSSGDAILMNTGGVYNPFRASTYLIDAVNVIDNSRNFNGAIATFTRLNVTGITTVATFNVGVSGQTLVGINTILDEDNMASDSATALATQQSIKAYVDTQVTAQDLDITDGSTTIAIDLDSETLSILGTANEVTSAASGNQVQLGLPDDVTIANDLTVASNAGIGSLSVTGISTFNGDTGFIGGGAGITSAYWDQSAASLKFKDNVKAQFGDNQNLSIYFDGDDSYIKDDGIGQLYIQGDAAIHLTNSAGTKKYFRGVSNGAAELYFNGTERLKTTGTGVEISDDLNVAGVSTFVGETNIGTGGTVFTALVGAAASVGIGTANPAYMLDVAGAINSSTDVKINGTSVLNSALDEAVAMAIALG
tara:strand:- start:8592 stop:11234 length:2643 start_codon:yes stop_codon:yes gene_type:complete